MNLKTFLCAASLMCISLATKADILPGCNCSDIFDEETGLPYISNPAADCSLSTCPAFDFDSSNIPCCMANNASNVPINFHSGWLIAIAGLLLTTFYFTEKYKVQR